MNIFGYNLKFSKPIKPDKSERLGTARISNLVYPTFGGSIEVAQPQDFDAQIAQYKSWVYVCASRNATSVANANLRLYVAKPSKDKKSILATKPITKAMGFHLNSKPGLSKILSKAYEIEEVLEHPILDLFAKVNETMNRFDLWEMTELFLELVGNSYWYIVKNGLGIPGQIWVLSAQNITVVPSKTEYFAGYLYTKGMEKIPFEKEEIVHFKFPNPSNSFYGLSPVYASGTAIALDTGIRVSENSLLKNMGRPEGVLSSEESIPEEDFKRLKEEYRQYSGPTKVGKVLMLERGLKYTPITLSPRDMGYLAGRKMNLQEICSIFGLPLSKVDPSHIVANTQALDIQYAKDTIEPRLCRIEEKMNEQLLPMYDPNLFVAFDSTVPTDQNFRLKETESNLKTGYSSINQERAKDHLEPVPWGERPWVNSGVIQISETIKELGKKVKKVVKSQRDELNWTELYEEGGAHWATDLQPSKFAQAMARKMIDEKKKTILEIGCGNGRDSILFALAGLKVTSIDIVPAAIVMAKENAKKAGVVVDFRIGNAEKLEFDEESFEAVFTLSVLHSTDLKKSLPEMNRILKPKGLAFLYLYSDVTKVDGTKKVFVSVNEFLELLKSNKFEILDFYTKSEDEFDEAGEKHLIIVSEVRK